MQLIRITQSSGEDVWVNPAFITGTSRDGLTTMIYLEAAAHGVLPPILHTPEPITSLNLRLLNDQPQPDEEHRPLADAVEEEAQTL